MILAAKNVLQNKSIYNEIKKKSYCKSQLHIIYALFTGCPYLVLDFEESFQEVYRENYLAFEKIGSEKLHEITIQQIKVRSYEK